jgi:hypothetical protein
VDPYCARFFLPGIDPARHAGFHKEEIMNRNRRLAGLPAAVLLAAMLLTTSGVSADEGTEKSKWGDWNLLFRYRLELVDQDPLMEDATASTLRTRVNYTSPEKQGLSFFGEFDYVTELGADDYNAGAGNTPDRGQYPVVADPDGEDLNQAYLQYANGKNQFRAGRQRIILDNARFVGNVGWRQNPQTYDALSYQYKSDGGLQFTAAHINRVHRIFGDDVPAGNHDHSTTLLNVSTAIEGAGKVTAYWYDIDNEDAAAFSTSTLGFRFSGSRSMEKTKVGYGFEFAVQQENANNTTEFDASYYRIDLSAGVGTATLYGGFESLGGDKSLSGQAFRTPLATLHAFNGWADKFLGTPGAGLEDVFFGAKGKLGAWSWNILYHDFTAESGSADFGSEIDASLATKIAGKYGLLLKAASFDTSSPAYGDTTKFWVQLTAGF